MNDIRSRAKGDINIDRIVCTRNKIEKKPT